MARTLADISNLNRCAFIRFRAFELNPAMHMLLQLQLDRSGGPVLPHERRCASLLDGLERAKWSPGGFDPARFVRWPADL